MLPLVISYRIREAEWEKRRKEKKKICINSEELKTETSNFNWKCSTQHWWGRILHFLFADFIVCNYTFVAYSVTPEWEMLATSFHKNEKLKSFQRELRTFFNVKWHNYARSTEFPTKSQLDRSFMGPSCAYFDWVRWYSYFGRENSQLLDVGQWSLLHVRRASWLMNIIDHNYPLAKFSCRRTFMI